ncbi:MAG: nucleotide sugar dehydrogenase [Chloroflexi bacterium]|nr:MAG: nucleotide sugar dehydrogenase [Chloroflexota bacterium]
MQCRLAEAKVCIVGLGYVGLLLAEAFSHHFKVMGFDITPSRVKELNTKCRNDNLIIVDDPRQLKQGDFIIITVPTPVTKSKEPDLSYVTSAAKIISLNMKAGCTVILESTVYPGVTEEVVKPILEEAGLKCGQDFKIAYSPERINPGDDEHTLDRIVKVVAGMDKETTELVAELYDKVCYQVYKAKDIRTAEAAKVIENIQRDLNIALMNEFCLIFKKMGLDTNDVLHTAATKWNFHYYSPGLVGGHCIPVDPYYLVYKSKELGYHPQVILSGRAINDYMPRHVAEITLKAINNVGKVIKGSKVLIMGLTYKENVADIRETPVKGIIKELKEYGIEIIGFDPLVYNSIEREFGIKTIASFEEAKDMDCLILTIVHNDFRKLSLDKLKSIMVDNPILIDVRQFFDRGEAEKKGIHYYSL